MENQRTRVERPGDSTANLHKKTPDCKMNPDLVNLGITNLQADNTASSTVLLLLHPIYFIIERRCTFCHLYTNS